MLAVCSAASLTVLHASPFTVTVSSGAGVRFIANNQSSSALSNTPFTAADFAAAQSGAAAAVVTPHPGWISSLPANPSAQWIAVDSNRTPRSILFAQRFNLPCRPLEGSVQLRFDWAADNQLGDPPGGANVAGVYINGVALPISGGNFLTAFSAVVSVPAAILNPGVNWLYVYVRDTSGVASGVIYSATLRGVCPSCTLDNEQPWNKCLPSTPSAVIDCAPPTPWNFLAAQSTDDFVATYTGAVNTVEWWGTLSHPAQRFRRFQINFYPQDPDCRPPYGDPIYSACVYAYSRFAGYDCNGKRVWKFTALLPPPYFNQVAGEKYWLMITEIDSESIRPGQTDFEWSGHSACNSCGDGAQVCNCAAIKFTVVNGSVFVNPVLGCQGEVTDLAWALRWRTHIRFVGDMSPLRSALVSIRLPDGGPVLESQAIILRDPLDVDGDGLTFLLTSLPEGAYELEVSIGGALPIRVPVTLEGGVIEVDLDNRTMGDLNGDGSVDDADLLVVLFNFGAGR